MDGTCSELEPSDPERGIDEVSRSTLSFEGVGRSTDGGAWSWFMFEESQEADGLTFWSQAERVV